MIKEKDKQRIQECKEQGLSKKATARKLKCNIKTIRKYWDGGGLKQISGPLGHGNIRYPDPKMMESLSFRLEEIETLPCNNCGTMLEVRLTEKQVKCPKCGQIFDVIRPIEIPCPTCDKPLNFTKTDKQVRCLNCDKLFDIISENDNDEKQEEQETQYEPYKYSIGISEPYYKYSTEIPRSRRSRGIDIRHLRFFKD